MEQKILHINQELSGKYILLDWNVIKYIKEPRPHKYVDIAFKYIIQNLRKKYFFPFCESHLRDLRQSYKQGYKNKAEEDLIFLEELSRNVGLLPNYKMNVLAEYSLKEYFDILTKEETPKIELIPKVDTISVIDMKKLDTDHPLRPMLEQTQGILSPFAFYRWLSEMFETFFTMPDAYNNMRNYIEKIQDGLCNNNTESIYGQQLIECSKPFLESFKLKSKDELCLIWKDVVNSWLNINFPDSQPPSLEVLLISYALLDMHPLFHEKINPKNKLDNLVRDSKLICYASSSEYFVTEDKKCYEKAKFIYKVYNKNTKVVKMEELLNKFS